jgi:hypothetical protein
LDSGNAPIFSAETGFLLRERSRMVTSTRPFGSDGPTSLEPDLSARALPARAMRVFDEGIYISFVVAVDLFEWLTYSKQAEFGDCVGNTAGWIWRIAPVRLPG